MKHLFEETLPNFEQYKNKSCWVISPRSSSKKSNLSRKQFQKKPVDFFEEPKNSRTGIILNNTIYEPKIINILRNLYNQYSSKFSRICNHILNEKYKTINKNIYKFSVTGFSNNNGIMGSIILNTDQNRPDFFSNLIEYMRGKAKKKNDNFDLDNIYYHFFSQDFNDLEKIFKDLSLDDDETVKRKSEMSKRLIIISEIQSIGNVPLSMFITRMLEYNKKEYPRYDYIIIYDVAYDPKILFDKINVSLLSKIMFFSIDNIDSNFLYQEILYNFIYKSNTGFYIPKSQSLRTVLTSILIHRISIESFKHYFNLILFNFFFMHQWDDDEYLLYLKELNENKIKETYFKDEKNTKILEKNIDNKRKEIFEKKLKEIYSSTEEFDNKTKKLKIITKIQTETENLLQKYKKKMNILTVFKLFYRLFEKFIKHNLPPANQEDFHPYTFLYEFLQYDILSNFDEMVKLRAKAVSSYFEKFEKQDESLKKDFFKNYKNIIEDVIPLLCEEDKNKLKELTIDLASFVKTLDNLKLEDVKNVKDLFNVWVKKLLGLQVFEKINDCEKESIKKNSIRKYVNVYKNYLEFNYLIEPPLMYSYLIDLYEFANDSKNIDKSTKFGEIVEINKDDFELKNVLRAYILCLMNLNSTFNFNHFFYDFLIEFGVTDLKDKKKLEEYKKVFLILSYWLNLAGIFHKKSGKKQLFVKNYYRKVHYIEKRK